MQTILPDPHEGVNPQPAYYAVIPASVRYSKSLPSSAKLFFGEITALCSVAGYCWASNAYFMALYDVDRSTLKRWISALSKEGFIRVELVSGTCERRIFDTTIRAQNPAQKCAPPGAKMRPPRRKNAPHSIILINKEINKKELLTRGSQNFVGPGPISAKELREKGVASPTSQNSKMLRAVEGVVAITRDCGSRGRFQQVYDLLERSGRGEVWRDAIMSLKSASSASVALVGGSAAYFCDYVASRMSDCANNALDAAGAGWPTEEVNTPQLQL